MAPPDKSDTLRERFLSTPGQTRAQLVRELGLDPRQVIGAAIGTYRDALAKHQEHVPTALGPDAAHQAALADLFLAGIIVGRGLANGE